MPKFSENMASQNLRVVQYPQQIARKKIWKMGRSRVEGVWSSSSKRFSAVALPAVDASLFK